MDKIVYTVRAADTLWGIARDVLGDHNKYRDIKNWNKIPGFALKPGMLLKLYNPDEGGETENG